MLLLLLDGIRLGGGGGVYRRRFRGRHSLGLLLGSIGTRGTRRSGRVIFLDKVLGKDTLSFGTGFIQVFTVIPLVILDRGDGYDLADGEDEIILVVGSVLEDRSDSERGVGHWRGEVGVTVIVEEVVMVGWRNGCYRQRQRQRQRRQEG